MTSPVVTPNYAPHTLVSFGGLIVGGPPNGDMWQCGIRVAEGSVTNGNGQPLTDPVTYMNDLHTTLSSWFTALVGTVGISGGATLAWLKVNNIGANGKYSAPAVTHRYDYPTPPTGPVTTAGQCAMVTLAYTFTTLRSRGAGSHGRIYLPLGLPATFSPSLGGIANYVTHAKNFLNAIARPTGAASAANGVFPVVASGRNGGNFQITGVKVGSVMDTQRRRKLQITETYTASTYP